MTDMSIGAPYVRRLAADRMGRQVAEAWLSTPNPQLEDGSAPEGLLQSGCPTCINKVLELVEAMP